MKIQLALIWFQHVRGREILLLQASFSRHHGTDLQLLGGYQGKAPHTQRVEDNLFIRYGKTNENINMSDDAVLFYPNKGAAKVYFSWTASLGKKKYLSWAGWNI